MICLTLQDKTLEEILKVLSSNKVEMAEIRLDRCSLSDEEIVSLFATSAIPLIATCRVSESRTPVQAERKLTKAIQAGANFVDIELEAPANMGKKLRHLASDSGTTFIRSYHNFTGTPSLEELLKVYDDCLRFGADIVKIVTTATCSEDVKRVEQLYSAIPSSGRDLREGSLIAFCMGEAGRPTRLDCLRLGAPYTYCCLSEGESAAPGQLPADLAREAIYGSGEGYFNEVDIPASKSFAQRAIVAAALAEGTSHLGGYQPCDDTESAVALIRSLGAKVEQSGDKLTITGIGPVQKPLGLPEVCTGESGLLTRLTIPVLAAINGAPFTVQGRGTLPGRPLTGANDIMAAFGVVLTNACEDNADSKEVHIPARIEGGLVPGKAEISGKGGSQLISGLLMALPLTDKPSTIYVTEPKSIPYMFITLDVLKKFGVSIGNEMEGDEEFVQTRDWSLCTGMTFHVGGGQHYKAADFDIEGDWSSAAAFMVAGAVFGRVSLSNLDISSLQADLTIMDVLVEAGACVSQLETGAVEVSKAPMTAFEVDLNNAPDLFPVVAVLAAFCAGTSRMSGVGRLAGKESDRASAITEMLMLMGVDCIIDGDDLVVVGHSLTWRLLNHRLLRGGKYSSHHDHRMVMALKVASLGADGPVEIDDTACVSKSFPTFFEKW